MRERHLHRAHRPEQEQRSRRLPLQVARFTLAAPAGFVLDTTARSHGWYDLPPFSYDGERLWCALETGGRAHAIAIAARRRALEVEVTPPAGRAPIERAVRAMLRLDEDLAPFYALTDEDPRLAWARRRGAGRLLRAPTAWEDVVKMLLTTNCSWAFTRKMVERLVANGEPVEGGSGRRAFPGAARLAERDERFFRAEVRAGYRAPHLVWLAREVASGRLDLEALREGDADGDLRKRLLALPGIGPYAADNLLRLLGGYQHLGLDSWCRAQLRRIYPRARDPEAKAEKSLARYGRYRGLALWLLVTRHWHEPT